MLGWSQMETTHVVYAIFKQSEPKRVRYVGLTSKGAHSRFRGHWKSVARGKKTKLYNWMRKYGPGQVDIRVIQEYPTRDEVTQGERDWIAYYRSRGQADLNLTDGGEGILGFRHSDEYREKRRQYMLNNPIRVEFTPEMRKAISESNKRRLSSPESRIEHANKVGKLRNSQVADIKWRIARGESHYRLAEEYGVSYGTINNIARNVTWTHVEWPFGPRNISEDSRPENRTRGELRSKKGLTDADVRAIREAAQTETYNSIGDQYGLTASGVFSIVTGKTWGHVAGANPARDSEIQRKAVSGERSKVSKLNDEKVRYVRQSHRGRGDTARLARELGVSETAIAGVVKGKTWKHVM